MVAVFVGDQNGREIFRRPANGSEARADLARRKSGVHEEAAVFGFDIGAIAAGAAAEDGEFDGHKGKLKRKAESGKRKTRVENFQPEIRAGFNQPNLRSEKNIRLRYLLFNKP